VLLVAAAIFAAVRAATLPATAFYAFYVNWDNSSYRALSSHLSDISTLVPEWYHVGTSGSLTQDNSDAQAKALALIRAERPGLRITPIVNDIDKKTGNWDSQEVAGLLHDPASRAKLADDIVAMVRANRFHGVNIDFEGLPTSSSGDLVAFMADLHDRAHPLGLEVSQDVSIADPTFDLPELAKHVDYLIPMMYDEHWSTSGAGPIASQSWYEDGLSQLFKQVPASKVIVAFGGYGFEWRTGSKNAKNVSFAQSIATASAVKTTIELNTASLNPTFSRTGHSTWLLDAVSAFNEIAFGRRFPVHGFALWRLGGEDPALWRVVRKRDSLSAQVAQSLTTPKRSIRYDATRKRIVAEKIQP